MRVVLRLLEQESYLWLNRDKFMLVVDEPIRTWSEPTPLLSIQSPEGTTWWDSSCSSYCWCAAPSCYTPHFNDGTKLCASCLLQVSCFARDSNALFLLATMPKLDDVILHFFSSYQSGHLFCCFVFCVPDTNLRNGPGSLLQTAR